MSTPTNNGYLLLLRGNEWYKELSQEKIHEVMNLSRAWFQRIAAEGKVKGGQALVRSGAIVSGKNGRTIADGPFAESKEAIGGYLLLDVATLEEAIAIAETSPALAYGTSIEVRPVAEECPLEACARRADQAALATANR